MLQESRDREIILSVHGCEYVVQFESHLIPIQGKYRDIALGVHRTNTEIAVAVPWSFSPR